MTPKIRVVVVDDSPFVCRLLASHFQSAPDMQTVATVSDGATAVETVKRLRPDAVTLDLEMPGLSGLETLERIMHEQPTPVLVVSGVSKNAAATALKAINLGAVDFVLKYTPGADTDPSVLRHEIISKVRSAAQIKVVRSLSAHPVVKNPVELKSIRAAFERHIQTASGNGLKTETPPPAGVVVIGASTGGPVALRDLLGLLPKDFPQGVIVVQHLPSAFSEVLAAQLNRQIPLKVKEAQDREQIESGVVLVAPGGRHLSLRHDGRIALNENEDGYNYCPSVDVAMKSAAKIYGARAKGVVLTGMGDDGSRGLADIRAVGGKTFAQDLDSCVVNGMPRSAIEKGVVDYTGSLEEIAAMLQQ